jgi:hypothetical protein
MRQKSALLGIAAAAAVSGTSFSALAKACPASATLSSYLSGGANATCTVLDKTISAMKFTATSSLPADFLTVIAVAITNDPGLEFELGAIDTTPSTISYTVTAPSSDPMTDASLALAAEPFGAGGATETLSNNKTLSASGSSLSDSTTFTAITSLDVTDATFLVGGFTPTTLTNQFSETPVSTPEPSSLALLGVGLSAFGLARRRKRR